MPENEALLATVIENPDDDAPRLVYADWLEENGESDRAELLRLLAEMRDLCYRADRFAELDSRKKLLRRLIDPAWLVLIGETVEAPICRVAATGLYIDLGSREGFLGAENFYPRLPFNPERYVAGMLCFVRLAGGDHTASILPLRYGESRPDPWPCIEADYPVGTRLRGTIRNLTNYGAFVEVTDEFQGLLLLDEMRRHRAIAHPSEMFQKGQVIEVVIAELDRERRRIRLALP